MRVASKSGSLDALRSDVGLVWTPQGRIAVAITVDDMPEIDYSPDNAGNLLISRLSQRIIAELR
jgi:beta-lactamase class A